MKGMLLFSIFVHLNVNPIPRSSPQMTHTITCHPIDCTVHFLMLRRTECKQSCPQSQVLSLARSPSQFCVLRRFEFTARSNSPVDTCLSKEGEPPLLSPHNPRVLDVLLPRGRTTALASPTSATAPFASIAWESCLSLTENDHETQAVQVGTLSG